MKYFTYNELIRSETAKKFGIDNFPHNNKTVLNNLRTLVETTLDPLRAAWGKPIRVNSGYRCPKLNAHPAIKGAPNSSHLRGQAADITTGSKIDNKRLWDLLVESPIPYTKVINEKDFSWLHVSLDINNISRIKLKEMNGRYVTVEK